MKMTTMFGRTGSAADPCVTSTNNAKRELMNFIGDLTKARARRLYREFAQSQNRFQKQKPICTVCSRPL
jgi:hypothetical protein